MRDIIMKIIEITGTAGVGKSYVLNILTRDKYVVSDMELIQKYHIYEIYLFYLFFKSKNSFKLLKVILEITKELNMSLFDKINFIRNTIKKIGKNHYLSNINFIDNRIVLVDEGISHIYQNVITTKTQNNLKILILLNKFISLIDKLPDEVIVVDAYTPTIIKRLKSRGHKRLKDVKEIELFVKNSKRNLSVIPKIFSNVQMIINEDGVNLENLKLVKRENNV
jgi:broad-specificity NMP kinase